MVSLCVLCTFRPKPVFTAPPGPIKSPWKSPYNDQSIGKAVNSCNCRNLSSDVLKTSDLVYSLHIGWANFGIVKSKETCAETICCCCIISGADYFPKPHLKKLYYIL